MGGNRSREQDSAPEKSALVEKWGSALNAGFQVVPNVLLRAQSRLNLDAVDVVILLNLNLHWWQKDSLPGAPRLTVFETWDAAVSSPPQSHTRLFFITSKL